MGLGLHFFLSDFLNSSFRVLFPGTLFFGGGGHNDIQAHAMEQSYLLEDSPLVSLVKGA